MIFVIVLLWFWVVFVRWLMSGLSVLMVRLVRWWCVVEVVIRLWFRVICFLLIGWVIGLWVMVLFCCLV